MIVAQKMEDAMDHQKEDLVLSLPSNRPGLASGSFYGDDHIPQNLGVNHGRLPTRHGKSDDVGGAVAIKILPVQPGDPFIIC